MKYMMLALVILIGAILISYKTGYDGGYYYGKQAGVMQSHDQIHAVFEREQTLHPDVKYSYGCVKCFQMADRARKFFNKKESP